MTWGLLDTKDNRWFGDDAGPKTFDDFMIARIAAQALDVQLGQRPGRTVAKEFDPGPKRKRDEVKTRMTSLQALEKIEKGSW